VLIIDNAKTPAGTPIQSPVIEANSTAPRITLRILGKSENFSRPNDFLWLLTMNNTSGGPDLVSRGIPIRFRWEGDPAQRTFEGPFPIEYAKQHRAAILGELAGMVEQWKDCGRPLSDRRHRIEKWSQVVGGILESCGIHEFLGNVDEAAAEFNSELNDLSALAEAALRSGTSAAILAVSPANGASHGHT
jgi:hypothetical protein